MSIVTAPHKSVPAPAERHVCRSIWQSSHSDFRPLTERFKKPLIKLALRDSLHPWLVSATPGRIVLEMKANNAGRVIKRGRLKVWTGKVPATPIEEAVENVRQMNTDCEALELPC